MSAPLIAMSKGLAAEIERLQNQLLESAPRSLSAAVQEAFRAVPRHAFVRHYLVGGRMVHVTEENLGQHLAMIYHNGTLLLWSDEAKRLCSTISQPTLVLLMLQQLNLAAGHKVFELGAGSGWYAGLMGHVVGASGRVYSSEIIPEIAAQAQESLAALGIANVEILPGDGGDGHAAGAPFDRAVFTAGTYDLPEAFHQQVRVGGLLQLVLKLRAGGDHLYLLEKKADCFETTRGTLCAFVPMVGKYDSSAVHPLALHELPGWSELRHREVDRRDFWWGAGERPPFLETGGARSFLSITEPHFQAFCDERSDRRNPEGWFVGVFDPGAHSLVVARRGKLLSYGNTLARDRFLARMHAWIDLGMPSASTMRLRVFPTHAAYAPQASEWLVKQPGSHFVWSLNNAEPAAP